MAQYDGTIRIDTSIDPQGFETAAKKMSTSLNGVVNKVKEIGAALIAVAAGYLSLNFAQSIVSQYDLFSSSFSQSIFQLNWAFQNLQGAIVNLIMTAFVPLIPYIIQIITWFTKLVQFVTMVVGALFGLDKTIGNIAKKTNSLAAFDKINVLNQNYGPAFSPPPMTIPQDLLDKINAFKKAILDFVQPFVNLFVAGWKLFLVIIEALKPLGVWLLNNFLIPLGTWVLALVIAGVVWLTARLNDLSAWITANPDKFRDFILVLGLVALAFLLVVGAIALLNGMMALSAIVTGAFTVVMLALASPFILILALIALLVMAFTIGYFTMGLFVKYGIEPIKNGLDSLGDKFRSVFTGIQNFLRGAINNIISLFNTMLNSVISGINALINGANAVGSIIPGYAPVQSIPPVRIPYLATGAVIPPNSQFLAMLGDQKTGRNIEAPEGLIRSIVSEEVSKLNNNISISFKGDLGALVRELKPYIDKENVRVGNNLVKRTGQVSIS